MLLGLIFSSSDKTGIRLNDHPLADYGLVWTTVPGTDMVAGYVMQHDVDPRQMTLRHVSDAVFSAHVNSKLYCEAMTMPLTYGRPLLGESVPFVSFYV